MTRMIRVLIWFIYIWPHFPNKVQQQFDQSKAITKNGQKHDVTTPPTLLPLLITNQSITEKSLKIEKGSRVAKKNNANNNHQLLYHNHKTKSLTIYSILSIYSIDDDDDDDDDHQNLKREELYKWNLELDNCLSNFAF